jgi:hypothetical protein
MEGYAIWRESGRVEVTRGGNSKIKVPVRAETNQLTNVSIGFRSSSKTLPRRGPMPDGEEPRATDGPAVLPIPRSGALSESK